MERFRLRPRLRLGAGGQTTFLSGPRLGIERTYRRSVGITENEEFAAMMAILDSSLFLQSISDQTSLKYTFCFGATLDEWTYSVQGDPGHFFSKEWLARHSESIK